jgi:hypothetical protein
MTTLIPLSMLVALLVAAVAAVPPTWTAGDATGSMTVNGQTVQIRHAYARSNQAADGIDYHIILSDVPVEAAVLNDEGEMWRRSREGKLHVLLLELHTDGKRRIDIRHPGFKPLGYVNAGGTAYRFEATVQTADRIAARAYMTAPATAFDDSWSYDVRFAAAVERGSGW